ncbi:Double-strand break repair protein AddB [Candidatus Bealeia paramacronuclearis]|uniref:Double-strand break repair protein AddB n=1 Tax=Candidatus Bealeia paramacronuclearis TaxID=1921001 RepID=A0ABZ2C497_9PROT|nr:Double-strand break repair protein AddB [Candidatus Bealeia paramacronuclearis]
MGKLYNIPLGHHFLKTLARGVLEEFSCDPLALSQVQILLPTRRACQEIKNCFYEIQSGKALLLPRISPLGEVGSEPNPLLYPDLPSPGDLRVIPPLMRQGLLLQLVERFQKESLKGVLPKSLSLKLTQDLISLIDQSQIERVPLERLHDIVPETYASHWQITLDFLKILFESWPQILRENHYIEPYAHHWESTDHLVRFWASNPPAFPIIAAGSTGTMPATRLLLKSILSFEKGRVVLPAYDNELDPEVQVENTHPQVSLRRLTQELDQEILLWPWLEALDPLTEARATLFRKMVNPKNNASSFQNDNLNALQNLNLVECKTLSEEALTIAVILREVLEDPEKAAVVITADQELELRIRAELERWGIELPLSKMLRTEPEGILVNLIGAISNDHFDPIDLLGFLKHPHVRCEGDITALEKNVFRTIQRDWTWEMLLQVQDDKGEIFPRALTEILSPLLNSQKEIHPLQRWTQKLKSVLEKIAPEFEESTDFQRLSFFLNQLEAASSGFSNLSMKDYFEILDELMGRQSHQEKGEGPARIQILGVLEARFTKCELMILAGLNEGSWPPEIHEDPWLSRPMRASMEFPSPERRIGLSAHDFGSAFSSPQVILTRSLRKGGTPTVPSRFLNRLEVTLKGEELRMPRDEFYKTLAQELDSSHTAIPLEAGAPTPPLAARPTQFYVTHVEMLRRDPYAYYARHILKLRPFDPINYPPRAADRGNLFHKILETIFTSSLDLLDMGAWDHIQNLAKGEFDKISLDSTTRLFWWNRFLRFGVWFLKTERELRTHYPELRTHVEAEGSITFKTPLRSYTLKAKADRLDLYPEGRVAVIDYKTGVPPTSQDVELGFAPQLPLEAAILQEGGFETLGVREPLSLAFWWLKNTGAGGEIKHIKEDAPLLAIQAFDGFFNLLEFYEDPNQGYAAEPLPEKALQYNDYEGVSRAKEWRRG